MARSSLSPAQRRSAVLHLGCTPQERKEIARAARREGVSLSTFLRRAALHAVSVTTLAWAFNAEQTKPAQGDRR